MHDERPSGWIHALVMDGQGGARAIAPPVHESLSLCPDESAWLHLDRGDAQAQRWLRRYSGLSAFACDVLLEENTRPRSLLLPEGGLLLFLRGINLNPGAEPEDMVSLRVYVDEQRVYSLRLRSSQVAEGIATDLLEGHGPKTSGQLLLSLASALTSRIEDVVVELNDLVTVEEERIEANDRYMPDHHQIALLRRRSAGLRRFLLPQREIFTQLGQVQLSWLAPPEQGQWNELSNRLIRHLEELDLIRERVNMLFDWEQRQQGERMNRTMYLLAVITVFFLPLSFLTGLLGINVGGIPGADSRLGFMVVCLLLGGVAVAQWLLLRRLRLRRM